MGSWMLGTKVDSHVCDQLFLNRNYRAKKKELLASLKLSRAKIQILQRAIFQFCAQRLEWEQFPGCEKIHGNLFKLPLVSI